MDSMRNLSTSLPRSGRRRTEQPELLTDFRSAALSVTNLYKTAAAAQSKARSAGYQDALDDLLVFLDSQNLGLMDGEGWKVRQWATERLDDDGMQRQKDGSDEEEDGSKDEEAQADTRSSSPEAQRKPTIPTIPTIPTTSSVVAEDSPHRRVVSEPPLLEHPQSLHTPPEPAANPSLEDFTFRSTHPYPSNHDREGNMDVDNSSTTPSTPSSTETFRIVPRSSRARHTNHNRHRENRTVSLNLGTGAGSKRKIPYPDFFDISGMTFDGHDRRDGGGGRGGKRGRHV